MAKAKQELFIRLIKEVDGKKPEMLLEFQHTPGKTGSWDFSGDEDLQMILSDLTESIDHEIDAIPDDD